ncbi:hypothetical protein EJ06DRAFT_529300 [Trichodelitschia bisporula]|uniref:Dolichyl-diphosphooligosaccharide--protein glycosyltransferase subunit 4 n=1 Tax=Trichodelitschia bisporula TaxID=703511 RepID=A0A6G1HZH6_9PEZI|nr:hypothetical protein EJ06DRAFT_529300 [Trichodelitschia bisporula]
MIEDHDLYSLALFLGSLAMVLIVVYHFVETNARRGEVLKELSNKPAVKSKGKA